MSELFITHFFTLSSIKSSTCVGIDSAFVSISMRTVGLNIDPEQKTNCLFTHALYTNTTIHVELSL